MFGFERLLVLGVPLGQCPAGCGEWKPTRFVTGVGHIGRRHGPPASVRIRFPEVYGRRASADERRVGRRDVDGGKAAPAAAFVVSFVSAVEPDGVFAMGPGERLSDEGVPATSTRTFPSRRPSCVRRTSQVYTKPPSARHIVLQLYTGNGNDDGGGGKWGDGGDGADGDGIRRNGRRRKKLGMKRRRNRKSRIISE